MSRFKGPQSYLEKDENDFRGRKDESEKLYNLVVNNDFCVCYAESGEGKTSLINAGVIPLLRDNLYFPICLHFSKNDFNKNVTKEVEYGESEINIDIHVSKLVEREIDERRKDEKYVNLTFSPFTLLTLDESKNTIGVTKKLNDYVLRNGGYNTLTPVLIFDQFEEIFTQAKNLTWIDSFFCWLEKLCDTPDKMGLNHSGPRFKVLLSMRSDYVSELDYWTMDKHFIPQFKNNRFCLKPLTRSGAREVISPLQLSNERLENIIESALIDKARNICDKDEKGDDLPSVSALALSLITTELERNGEVYNNDESRSLKDLIISLLSNRYEKAIAKCCLSEEDRDRLENTLIDNYGKRNRVSQKDINLHGLEEALTILIENRFIRQIGDNVELAHDCLTSVVAAHRDKRLYILEKERREALEREENAIRKKHCIYVFLGLLSSFACSYLWLYFHSYDIIVRVFAGIGNISDMLSEIIYPIVSEIIYPIVIAVIPSLIISFFFIRRWGVKHIRNVTSPIAFLLFVYSCFVFWNLVFCPLESDGIGSSNSDSAVMVLLTPLLFFSIYQRNHITCYLIYASLLSILMLNAFCKVELSYNMLLFLLFLTCLFLVLVYVFIKQIELKWYYKFFLIISNIVVLITSVVFQLGFCPLNVDYDLIQRDKKPQNWSVLVASSPNYKIGVIEQSGEWTLPAVFDTIQQINNGDNVLLMHTTVPLYPSSIDSLELCRQELVKNIGTTKGLVFGFSDANTLYMQHQFLVSEDALNNTVDGMCKCYIETRNGLLKYLSGECQQIDESVFNNLDSTISSSVDSLVLCVKYSKSIHDLNKYTYYLGRIITLYSIKNKLLEEKWDEALLLFHPMFLYTFRNHATKDNMIFPYIKIKWRSVALDEKKLLYVTDFFNKRHLNQEYEHDLFLVSCDLFIALNIYNQGGMLHNAHNLIKQHDLPEFYTIKYEKSEYGEFLKDRLDELLEIYCNNEYKFAGQYGIYKQLMSSMFSLCALEGIDMSKRIKDIEKKDSELNGYFFNFTKVYEKYLQSIVWKLQFNRMNRFLDSIKQKTSSKETVKQTIN